MQFNDFSSTSGLTINGDAAANINNGIDPNPVLRLTPALGSQAGSAFSTATINAATFSTFFTFRITDPGGTLFDGNTTPGADGLVFVVQPIANNVGTAGQGIGYSGIPKSIGVEFDTWHNSFNNDPDSNHLGIDINGSVVHTSVADTLGYAERFDDGQLWYVWIDYDGTTLDVRANQTGIRSVAADLSKTLDLVSILGQTSAYVGFTSGTGADWGNHDIVNWEYRDTFDPITPTPTPVPEPMSLGLVAVGLASLGVSGRRRRPG